MKLKNAILPAVALGVAATMIVPAQDAEAYSLLGFTLPQTQRDFRIFNNFSDSTANNNNVPDPNWPGHQGAVMAIWKACVEWQSRLHGTGDGDPHQNGGVGSGGANFDPSFQGEATGIGGINDNVHSEVSSCSSGVLAYTESPGSNGWRIRYCSTWLWEDGPGFHNNWDLQGVACHEYGHALGLGHTTANGATMYPSIGQSGSEQSRSIETDDKNGIKAAYGTLNDNVKPRIDNIALNGSQITITGANFAASNNQIWFTQAGVGGTGTPIKVTGLTSNGTSLTATVPANAGPGDVLVRNNLTGHDDLSEADPSDLDGGPGCPTPQNFCITSPNSQGQGMQLSFAGTSSQGAENLTLFGFGGISNQVGIFYYGPDQTQQPFGEGFRCIGAGATGTFRLPIISMDSFGDVSYDIDWNSPPISSGTGAWDPGDVWNIQFWYRDPSGGPSGFNLSDALEITVCP